MNGLGARLGRVPWALFGILVLTQICYPLTAGALRAALTVVTVVLGYLLSVSHALLSRGVRAAAALVVVATGGGLAVEAVGVATGFPFGTYDYSGQLGPKLLGVPLIIPLAWTWMAWPAWLAAVRLTGHRLGRIALAAVGLAAWDLFLDPQMVAEGYWTWQPGTPALPGVPGIPIGNYLGWLGFAVVLMAALSAAAGPTVAGQNDPGQNDAGQNDPGQNDAGRIDAGRIDAGQNDAGQAAGPVRPGDGPMVALWLWTYASSVLAHAVFLGLPASALWGGVIMGAVVLPLVRQLVRRPAPVTT